MPTAKLYLKRPKKNGILKTEAVSIMLKFTLDKSNRFEISTGERVAPVAWDSLRQCVKTSHRNHVELNQSLRRIQDTIIQTWRDNKTADIATIRALAAPLVKFVPEEKKTVIDILLIFTDQCRREKDPKTVSRFTALHAKLTEYNPSLTFDKLDNNFYDSFKQWLFDLGLLDSTVYKYIINLCTFLSWADSRGYKVHFTNNRPTHKSWEIIRRVNEPIALTLAELEKVEALQITEEMILEKLPAAKHGRRGTHTIQALEIARDYLVMECRTCQRISDLKSFDHKDMVGMVWYNRVTKGKRLLGKITKVPFNTNFTRPALAILQKYAMQLPVISEQALNGNIKTVCKLAGIDQPVTVTKWKQNKAIEITKPKHDWLSTHTGRKTFITIALQFMEPKLVKDMAGISWATLKHYEGPSEDQALIDGLNSIPVSGLMKAG